MQKSFNLPHNIRVEIDITPEWWSGEFGPKNLVSNNPKNLVSDNPKVAGLISTAMLMAVELYPNSLSEVRISRQHLKLLTMVPTDTTNAALCERAGQLVERMNALCPG